MTDIQKAELTIALNCARDIMARCEGNLGTKPDELGKKVLANVRDSLCHIEYAVAHIRLSK